jgi:signal transduction histidine kinase
MSRLLAHLPRPLDPLRSFKAKASLLVGLSLLASSAVLWILSDWPFRYAVGVAVVVAVVVVQLLAHGMTSPLREMTAAARGMARGRYGLRVRATSRDEIGQLAVAFNQMSADLAAADQQRRELVANVAHELRTPISALQAVLENVVDGVVEPDATTWETALRQTERLGRLVTELLDLSRLQDGAVPLQRSEFAVEPFLRDVIAQAGVRAQLDVQPAGLTAVADQARLHQVVANLLDNAVRHGPAHGDIQVLAHSNGDGLVLEVVDEGAGIPVQERQQVFERFSRGGAVDGGTGLGLAIAKWAVELHGGSIAVVGDQPGCRIRCVLPMD